MVGHNDVPQPDDAPINMLNPDEPEYGPHAFYNMCNMDGLNEHDKLVRISYAIFMCMKPTMSMLYSEDNINKYTELRELIIKPYLSRTIELGLPPAAGPIVHDPVLFIWYFNTFKNHNKNTLERLCCFSDEKIIGIQIILMNNLTIARKKISKWISQPEFNLIYHNFSDACKDLLGADITYETFIDRMSED
jgi:hypothetical protein